MKLWERLPWIVDAECKDQDPELWFPSRGGTNAKAKVICSRCKVREECLEYALQFEPYGTWGGLGEGERERLKRQRRGRAIGGGTGMCRKCGRVTADPSFPECRLCRSGLVDQRTQQ